MTAARFEGVALGVLALAMSTSSAEVEERLDRGEIVIETSMVAGHDDRVVADGTVDITADCDAVWSAILDFPARVAENWMVQDVSVYHDGSRKRVVDRSARWDLRVMGVDIRYHTTYRGDLTSGQLDWALDADEDNDLKYAAGTYHVAPHDDRTRLHYRFVVASKHRLTPWLRRKLTRREVKRLLHRIRTRAEDVASRRPRGR